MRGPLILDGMKEGRDPRKIEEEEDTSLRPTQTDAALFVFASRTTGRTWLKPAWHRCIYPFLHGRPPPEARPKNRGTNFSQQPGGWYPLSSSPNYHCVSK